MATAEPTTPQRVVIYGPQDEPSVYATVYSDEQARDAIKHCCARHGNACAARTILADSLPIEKVKRRD